ncbi:RNA-binding S4 domain-containing protein [Leucobacter weissii]|uniref:RNA-binding S4 domain-containing protein n=1 Tax=Leucobacter weissii TaxID=1983706 RepID=A0A939MI95_9MICO|nr:RNA-binding S4 domain-containing protein [Leucobacter weissii]MBO1901238.1 RNA-binding S4 domain-containing protein [Leucobacter weissii]
MSESPPSVRIDAWVWAARLAKTRSQATAACKAGHVQVNDGSAKPAQAVRIGDVVRVRLHDSERLYRVAGLATRRGSAAEAARLFEDLTPPAPPRVERPAAVLRERGAGRPTKRDRREIDRLRGRALP